MQEWKLMHQMGITAQVCASGQWWLNHLVWTRQQCLPLSKCCGSHYLTWRWTDWPTAGTAAGARPAHIPDPELPAYQSSARASVSLPSLLTRHWGSCWTSRSISQDDQDRMELLTLPGWLVLGDRWALLCILCLLLLHRSWGPVHCHWQQLLKLPHPRGKKTWRHGAGQKEPVNCYRLPVPHQETGAAWGCLIRKFCLSHSSCRPSHISRTIGEQVPSKT